MQRRLFLQMSLTAALTPVLAPILSAAGRRPPRILLYNGWQTENIGDVAHAPGLLALLEGTVPDAEVTFWPHYAYLPDEEAAMLLRRFPKLRIVRGRLEADGTPSAEVAAAMDACDFFLHGSGPATVGWRQIAAFRRRTGKPFGVFGVTYGLWGVEERPLLGDAAFVYFRDSVSLAKARADGVKAPVMAFGPDAAFAADVRDDGRAAAYLESVNLAPQGFVVCIPKQRWTPSWLHVHKDKPVDAERHARNEAMKEHDHAPLREAITRIVRQTGLKVLIGHEDETELPIGRDWVLDRLPADVRSRCVWRDTLWPLPEATGVYAQAAAMVSLEMHSPILCIGLGVPAVVCRWDEQSSKGEMWRDIGLGEWLFDFDHDADVARVPDAALALVQDLAASKAKALQARDVVRRRFAESMGVVKTTLGV